VANALVRTVASCALSALSAAAIACSGGSAVAPAGQSAASSIAQLQPFSSPTPSRTPITHVVIVVMENRSMNYMFNGYPGAYTVSSGPTHTGQVVTLQTIPLEARGDLGHNYSSWVAAYDNAKMDGFDLEGWDPHLPPLAPYAHAPQTEVQTYWNMASQYTLGDEMFQPNKSNSYPAHQYLIAGTSDYAIGNPHGHNPWGCDAPSTSTVDLLNANLHEVRGPFPCFDYQTLGDLLDLAQVSWGYYAVTKTTHWQAYDAISHIRYGADWTTNIKSPTTQFQADIAAGQLPMVSWVIPTNKESDHSGNQSASGPSFVASVVNAVGQSAYWNTTAIFVVWDDWGGWYDPVAPQQLDRMGLGFRVPVLVISPYARHGYVSHVPHEFGSILHYVESTFRLGSLGTSDARADDMLDCFDYSQNPPPFTPFVAQMGLPELRQIERTDDTPPDD